MLIRRFLIIAMLSLSLCLLANQSLANIPTAQQAIATNPIAQAPQSLEEARKLYQSGDLDASVQRLQQLIQQSTNEPAQQSIALSNLALVYGQQGKWVDSNQAIDQSLKILTRVPDKQQATHLLGQTLHLKGRLTFAQGQTQQALQNWQLATQAYQQVGDFSGEQRSQLRQAQALQSLGFYQRSLTLLATLASQLESQPDSAFKAEGLRNLGEMLAIVGQLASRDPLKLTAQTALERSVEVAAAVQDRPTIDASKLALANYYHNQAIEQFRRDSSYPTAWKAAQVKADSLYEEISQPASNDSTPIRAQLNQMRLQLELQQPTAIATPWQTIQQEISQFPSDQSRLDMQINLLDNQLKLYRLSPATAPTLSTIQANLLAAKQLATNLKQSRSIAYLAMLSSEVAASQNDMPTALKATDEGLFWAKGINSPEIMYKLYNQRGKLLEQQGQRSTAITAYKNAVATLQTIRSDVDEIASGNLFSFQTDINPIYRNLVRLLLDEHNNQPNETTLKEARNLIESLQVAELNNYLGADCLQVKQVDLERLKASEQTAIIYPIILPDRLAVITSLPSGKAGTSQSRSFQLFSTPINQSELNQTLQELRIALADRIDLEAYQAPSQKVYNWLIRPLESALAQSQVKTLTFVLDGNLRNLPMAALNDGKQYLVEKYNLAITPSLQLTDPKPLENRQLGVLAFGLVEKGGEVKLPNGQRRNFPQLPNVKTEITSIQSLIQNTKPYLDREFTEDQFRRSVSQTSVPIVHLATHGEFGSDRDSTFLLLSDQSGQLTALGLDDLSASLNRDSLQSLPLELLILSACETAAGDDRASLGIAGVALRSGARSTIASLWSVDDQATSLLMTKLYEAIKTQKKTRAEALQKAQLELLKNPVYRHPYYWAPFILVGSWL
jgi:CHAT domain-containing protein/predicted negative regulator of RcsB-dependent stress response